MNPTISLDIAPYCCAAALRNRLYAGVGLAVLFMACSGKPVCETNINDSQCGLTIAAVNKGKLFIYPNSDRTIKVQINGRLDNEEIKVDLVKAGNPDTVEKRVSILAARTQFPSDFSYDVEIKKADLQGLAPGAYSLRFQERQGRDPGYLHGVSLRAPLRYSPAILSEYAGSAAERPVAEQIGFVDNTVVTVNSGLDVSQNPAKQVRIYNYDGAHLDNPAPTGFFANPFPGETLAGFSQSDVFLLHPAMANLLLRRCGGVMPATEAACPTLDPSLQKPLVADKALVVTADGTQVVRADASGKLWQATTQAPLKWGAVATMAMVSAAATVKLASGDLNADGKADLVAIWQEGSSQQVWVFLGQAGGFIEDSVWTQRLQEGLKGQTVTALAVGDVDADGCADVVVGRKVVGSGLELAIVQNQQDRFVEGWSQTIDPPRPVKEISAVAVGRLDGSAPSQSLDIVATSNTPYDMTSMPYMSTLYLHAFRPQ